MDYVLSKIRVDAQEYESKFPYPYGAQDNFLDEDFAWLDSDKKMGTEWLGNGNTSKEIIGHIRDFFS